MGKEDGKKLMMSKCQFYYDVNGFGMYDLCKHATTDQKNNLPFADTGILKYLLKLFIFYMSGRRLRLKYKDA